MTSNVGRAGHAILFPKEDGVSHTPYVGSSVGTHAMPPALLLAMLALAADPISIATPKRDKPVSYGSEVADILEGKCVGCHSEVSPRSRFRIDSVGNMIKGGRKGPALVPGKADESLLFQMASHRVDPIMPPANKSENKALTPEELGILKLWIDAGAKDDSAEVSAAKAAVELGSIGAQLRPIVAVDMTADGKRVAFGQGDRVRVCDADTGLEIVSLEGHKDFIQSLRFGPDGGQLAAGSYQIATLWNAPKGGEARTFRGHDAAVNSAVATADGETLISAGEDGTIRVWSVAKGKEQRLFFHGSGKKPVLALTPTGRPSRSADRKGRSACSPSKVAR